MDHSIADPRRPTESSRWERGRGALHVVLTSTAALYYYFSGWVGAWVLLFVGITFVLLDLWRIRSARVRAALPAFVRRTVREREQTRLSAITHFVAAATIIDGIDILHGLPRASALLATLYLSVGDPLARVAGRGLKWGKLPGLDKTLIGSLVFFAAGTATAATVAWLLAIPIELTRLALGGLGITLVEACSGPYDNFAVPLLGTLLMWGLMFS